MFACTHKCMCAAGTCTLHAHVHCTHAPGSCRPISGRIVGSARAPPPPPSPPHPAPPARAGGGCWRGWGSALRFLHWGIRGRAGVQGGDGVGVDGSHRRVCHLCLVDCGDRLCCLHLLSGLTPGCGLGWVQAIGLGSLDAKNRAKASAPRLSSTRPRRREPGETYTGRYNTDRVDPIYQLIYASCK